jgi:Leucine-rich repeat (LRR) protein
MFQYLFENNDIFDIYENLKTIFKSNTYFLKDNGDDKKLNIIYQNNPQSFNLKKVHENSYFSRIFKEILNEKEKEISALKSRIKNLEKRLKQCNFNMKDRNLKIYKNNNGDQSIININKFNSIYHTTLDLDRASLDLNFQNKGDDLLMDLSNLNFNCLKELIVRESQISNINPFKNMNLDKLQTLNLYNNKVKDLSPLIKADLIELENINLQKNIISDIRPLIELNCNNLKILLLNNNQIEDITPLTKVKFYGLQKLTLEHNLIKDISALEYVPFIQLKILSLHHNHIKDIRVFEKIINNLKSLESLWLYENDFKNNDNDYIINILSKTIKDFL